MCRMIITVNILHKYFSFLTLSVHSQVEVRNSTQYRSGGTANRADAEVMYRLAPIHMDTIAAVDMVAAAEATETVTENRTEAN